MARGYQEDEEGVEEGYRSSQREEGYRPSRPARRVESLRGGATNHGYSAHYAESPVIRTETQARSLPRPRPRSHGRSGGTLPRSDVGRSASRASKGTAGPGTTVSKVTRSRSWGAKPAGVVVYNRHGEPTGMETPGYTSPAPASTVGLGYRPSTALSAKSGRSHTGTAMTGASGMSTVKSKNTMKAGLAVETMSAPNPFCPNTRGVCCLMVLANLALILICIGFIIVLQLTDPPVIWNIGIVILVFGFVTLFITLIYCMCICQETSTHKAGQPPPGELYWTHHWQKNFTIPELSTKDTVERWEDEDRFPEDNVSDTSSRDYPRLYLESDYGQRTDREEGLDTDVERAEKSQAKRYADRERERDDY